MPVKFLEAAITVVIGEEGIKKMVGMIDSLEVPELKNLLNLLWKQNNFFKKTFDMIRDSVVIIKQNGEIFYCNSPARDLLGITEGKQQKVLWKYIPEFVVLSDFSKTGLCEKGSFLSKEIKVSYPRKSILNVTITNCELDVDDGCLFLLRIVDVTEEKALNEKAINNEKLSSIMLLAGSVAHEIGNPLNSIGLRLKLMQRQLDAKKNDNDFHDFEKSLDICLGEISRLDGVIRNFLQAIRPSMPKMEDVHLDHLLKESIDVMDVEFSSLNIKVFCKFSQVPVILGDPSQIKQVFFNILKNASEAISGSGMISVDAYATDEDVVVSFTDNGVGIPCDFAGKIFQPYFSTKGNGNGLGMMIIERIIREHNAKIDIASTQGVGTKITLSFPRKDKRLPLLK